MTPIPITPFTAIHEEILVALAPRGARYFCVDPDEEWAPYLGAMLDAGLLAVTSGLGYGEFIITDAGRRRLEALRLGVVD